MVDEIVVNVTIFYKIGRNLTSVLKSNFDTLKTMDTKISSFLLDIVISTCISMTVYAKII